jgi:hypothetical protein
MKKTLTDKLLGTGDKRKLRIRLFLFSCIALIIGLLTPHLFQNNFPLNRRIAESLMIVINISFIFTFIWFHWRDVKEMEKDKKRTEELLSESFKTLGVANRKIDLISNFVNAYKLGHEGMSKREVIYALFSHLMVSILGSPLGILRIIDKNTTRTLTEWKYADAHVHGSITLPNKLVIEDKGITGEEHKINYYKSDEIEGIDAVCVLGFIASDQDIVERSFIRTLLNQILLLIHAFQIISTKRPIKKQRFLIPGPM